MFACMLSCCLDSCTRGVNVTCVSRAGLLKLLLAFEHGTIPANLHFNDPNPKIQSLKDGTIKVGCQPPLA